TSSVLFISWGEEGGGLRGNIRDELELCHSIIGRPPGALDPNFFFVNSYETWKVAQKYCRENYVDLVTVTNIKVVEKINSETEGSKVWIGLHRAPNFFWSDGSNFTFSNWDSIANELNSMKVICAVTSSTKGGKWKFLSCEEKLPFVCYSIPHG
uniref:C-type lectin domain-containing protein n=1 Tax=Gouania willdenowi TaxID=441366 RepID=A0A8C5E6A9_GOUWI